MPTQTRATAFGVGSIFLSAIAVLMLSVCRPAWAQAGPTTRPSQPPAYFTNVGIAPVDQPGLPKVLILGDSISIGYTCSIRAFLKDKAVVYRPNDNGKNSANLLAHLTGDPGKSWLGTTQWDVIHFNCGIWDTYYVDKKSHAFVDETKTDPQLIQFMAPPEEYRANLTKIVALLQAASKHVVWASSTPVTDRKGARFEDIAKFNAIAAEVMKAHGVEIDDLYAFTSPHVPDWQIDFTHFDQDSFTLIGQKAGQSILDALAKPATAK